VYNARLAHYRARAAEGTYKGERDTRRFVNFIARPRALSISFRPRRAGDRRESIRLNFWDIVAMLVSM